MGTANNTTIVTNKIPIVIPPAIQRRAGIKAGDRLEFKVSGGIISILPKLPPADDEYTPEQRRLIDAELAEASKGPYYGPFETADAAVKFLEQEIRKRKTGKHLTTRR